MNSKQKQRCGFVRHFCSRYRYRDYKYCFQHMLEDKSAPFRSCQYISKITKRKCCSPAITFDHNSNTSLALCEFHKHAKVNYHRRNKHQDKHVTHKSIPRSSSEQLKDNVLKTMRKYADAKSLSTSNIGNDPEDADFVGYERDFCNELESDAEMNDKWSPLMSSIWKCGEPELDFDFLTDNEDPLKNAGTYSLEEVVSLSRGRIVKLQSLYIDQFRHLHRTLQESRRSYLVDRMTQGVNSCKENGENHLDTVANARELRQLLKFRRRSKESKLLHNESKRRRIEATSTTGRASLQLNVYSNKSRCSHLSNHTRCKMQCLPYTKYCVDHILEDPLQVLYKKCCSHNCTIPVCLLYNTITQTENSTKTDQLNEESYCVYHKPLKQITDDLHFTINRIEKIRDDEMVTTILEDDKATSCMDNSREASKSPVPTKETLEASPVDERELEVDQTESVSLSDVMTTVDTGGPSKVKSDVDILSQCKDEAITDDPGSDLQLSKDVTHNLLTEHNLDNLETGQCFLLSRVSLRDEHTSSSKSALHLQPVNPIASGMIVPEQSTEKPRPLKLNVENMQTASLRVADETNTAEIQHQGVVMSITNAPRSETASNPHNHTVMTSATLVPPRKEDCIQDNDLTAQKDGCPINENVGNVNANNNASPDSPLHEADHLQSPSSGLDRKPSSADEETAVASLLSLSMPSL